MTIYVVQRLSPQSLGYPVAHSRTRPKKASGALGEGVDERKGKVDHDVGVECLPRDAMEGAGEGTAHVVGDS